MKTLILAGAALAAAAIAVPASVEARPYGGWGGHGGFRSVGFAGGRGGYHGGYGGYRGGYRGGYGGGYGYRGGYGRGVGYGLAGAGIGLG